MRKVYGVMVMLNGFCMISYVAIYKITNDNGALVLSFFSLIGLGLTLTLALNKKP